ncbi:DUF4224 domain-containing protein [Pseudohaliea rubra]|uniref:DUF4224 domain-containing protein n=1 Tax=Pseudohaliea rubra TaxID=475795 RepID=UPI000A02BFED
MSRCTAGGHSPAASARSLTNRAPPTKKVQKTLFEPHIVLGGYRTEQRVIDDLLHCLFFAGTDYSSGQSAANHWRPSRWLGLSSAPCRQHHGELSRGRGGTPVNEPIALTPEELRDITGFKLASKQMEALSYMGIPFKARPDGTPFVARSVLASSARTTSTPRHQPTLKLI